MRIMPFCKTYETQKQQNFCGKRVDGKSFTDFLETLPFQKQKEVLEQLINPDTVNIIKCFDDYNGRDPLFSIIKASEMDPVVKSTYKFSYESPYYLVARYPNTKVAEGISPLDNNEAGLGIFSAFISAGHLLEMNKDVRAWAINKAEKLGTKTKVLKDVIGELNLSAIKIREMAKRIDPKKIKKVFKIEDAANEVAREAARAIIENEKIVYIDPAKELNINQALDVAFAQIDKIERKTKQAQLKAEKAVKKITNLNEAIKNAQTPEKELELKFKKFLLTVNDLPFM